MLVQPMQSPRISILCVRVVPEYVLILSGDHIYEMDYDMLVQYHRDKGADATVCTIRVPLDEASRFGILDTDA